MNQNGDLILVESEAEILINLNTAIISVFKLCLWLA